MWLYAKKTIILDIYVNMKKIIMADPPYGKPATQKSCECSIYSGR